MSRDVKARKIVFDLLYPLCAVGLMLGIWAIAAAAERNPLVMPSPAETFRALGAILASGMFWRAFFGTLGRTLLAFFVSVALAAALAVGANLLRPLRRIAAPIVSVLRAAPTVAVVLLLVIWSTPRVAPVVVAALVIGPVLYTAILSALDGVDGGLLEMSRVYRVPRTRRVRMIVGGVLPALVPQLASSLSLSVKLMVAAEVLAATAQSLGGRMQQMSAYWETAQLFAYTLVAIAVALALEYAVLGIARLVRKVRK